MNRFNVDSFFRIGSTHKICQDYALHHSELLLNYALVADGCSGAENTDFGSRLLVKSVEPLLKSKSEWLHSGLTEAAAKNYIMTQALGLNEDCLCSTIIGVYEKDDAIHTFMVGDGIIAAVDYNNQIVVYEYEFKSGAPYYLYYELCPKNKEKYFTDFGKEGSLRKHNYDPKTGEYTVEDLPWKFCDQGFVFCGIFPVSAYKTVAIMSDGVKSFIQDQRTATGRQPVAVGLMDVVKEVMAFKNTNGEFVQRRCSKAFKQFESQGIQNTDDFSIAVIHKVQQ